MKGRVYDIYTGTGWEAAEEPSYRFGSEAFADEYRRTFSIGKPSTQAGAAPLGQPRPFLRHRGDAGSPEFHAVRVRQAALPVHADQQKRAAPV